METAIFKSLNKFNTNSSLQCNVDVIICPQGHNEQLSSMQGSEDLILGTN